MTRADMLQALREAWSHVYQQQHHGKFEKDRIDAKAWLERWVIPSNDLGHYPCNCVQCTADRAASRDTVDAQNEAEDFFVNAGIAAAEALKAKGGECEECGGLGHTIGFEGPKKIKYPCESCATGEADQVIAEKREMDARMFLSDLERGE